MKRIVYFKSKKSNNPQLILMAVLFCVGVIAGCFVYKKFNFVVNAQYLAFQVIILKNLKLFIIIFLLSFSSFSAFLLPGLILLLGFSVGCFLCEAIVNGSFLEMLKVAICYLPHLFITIPIVSFLFKERILPSKENSNKIIKTGVLLLAACILVSVTEYLLKTLFM